MFERTPVPFSGRCAAEDRSMETPAQLRTTPQCTELPDAGGIHQPNRTTKDRSHLTLTTILFLFDLDQTWGAVHVLTLERATTVPFSLTVQRAMTHR